MLALVAAVAVLAWRQLGHDMSHATPVRAVAGRPT